MEAKKKNQDQLQGQLSVFMKVVSNLEPMLKRLEEEKAERNKATSSLVHLSCSSSPAYRLSVRASVSFTAAEANLHFDCAATF